MSVWLPPRLPASLVKTRRVVPVTLPVMISVSDAPAFGRKLALSVTRPPPAKLPVTVSASEVSLSFPTSSVPSKSRVPAVRPCVPAPKLMLESAPTLTVSQPVTFAPVSAPDTSLSARVLVPAPPVSAVMFAMLVSSSVRFPESASLIVPLIVAPLSTKTLSQPLRPSDTTVACRLPVPLLNFSMSPEPSPPSNSVTSENAPPANVSVSAPLPRLTLPAIAAPVFTVTAGVACAAHDRVVRARADRRPVVEQDGRAASRDIRSDRGNVRAGTAGDGGSHRDGCGAAAIVIHEDPVASGYHHRARRRD